jgi:hypothetical protein
MVSLIIRKINIGKAKPRDMPKHSCRIEGNLSWPKRAKNMQYMDVMEQINVSFGPSPHFPRD